MKTILLLASLFAFASCSNNPNTNNNRANTRTNTPCADDQDSDWKITTRVKSALMSDGSISGSARMVSVETNDGVVTLTGSVASADESRYIERKVKSMNGVRSVDNQLTIKP